MAFVKSEAWCCMYTSVHTHTHRLQAAARIWGNIHISIHVSKNSYICSTNAFNINSKEMEFMIELNSGLNFLEMKPLVGNRSAVSGNRKTRPRGQYKCELGGRTVWRTELLPHLFHMKSDSQIETNTVWIYAMGFISATLWIYHIYRK